MIGNGRPFAPPTPGRREEHSEDTRTALVAAARQAFAEKGYADTSLDDIVGRARLTKGALYHHFESKAVLFRAVYEQMEQEVVAAVGEAVLSDGDDPARRVRVALDAFLTCSSEPSYVQIVLRDGPVVLGKKQEREIDHNLGFDVVVALVESLRSEGYLPDLPLAATARMLLAAASDVAVTMAHSDDPDRARAEGTKVVLAVFEGLVALARAEAAEARSHPGQARKRR